MPDEAISRKSNSLQSLSSSVEAKSKFNTNIIPNTACTPSIDCHVADAPRKDIGQLVQTGCFAFEIECETGTYIRSLAKLLAQKLGTVAIASTIIRTRVGNFDIADSKSLEEVTICDILPI